MITEDYVSFETAKLLKEKGFDIKCDHYYIIGNPPPQSGLNNGDFKEGKCNNTGVLNASAPTQALAMRWLREVCKLTISPFPYAPLDRNPHDAGVYDHVYIGQIYNKWYEPLRKSDCYISTLTYEEACEAAIKYCLTNLIK